MPDIDATSTKPEVFIVAATTIDGFIARNKTEFANWTSPEDKKRFVTLTKEAGIMVMGATTFRTFPKPLPGRHHVIYSRTERFEDKWPDGNVETTTLEPAKLIEELARRGYTKIAICGGESIYTAFLEAGVVTHMYLTIEPIQFGNGIRLLSPTNESQKDIQWKLLKSETTENGTVFLDYLLR
ncbi:MAG: dihydrofolate reductase FolA [Candidatus Parcubacteria bacterium]|jgi:dihydrofolate reductase